METALSTLSILPNTPEQVELFANKLNTELTSGSINPLELKLYLKAMEKVAENIKETLDPLVRAEAEKYGSKSFMFRGATLELSEVGTKYDYSNCGDAEWDKLNADAEKILEKKKNREVFLRGIKGSLNIIDGDSVPCTIYPPVKKSTSSVKITI